MNGSTGNICVTVAPKEAISTPRSHSHHDALLISDEVSAGPVLSR